MEAISSIQKNEKAVQLMTGTYKKNMDYDNKSRTIESNLQKLREKPQSLAVPANRPKNVRMASLGTLRDSATTKSAQFGVNLVERGEAHSNEYLIPRKPQDSMSKTQRFDYQVKQENDRRHDPGPGSYGSPKNDNMNGWLKKSFNLFYNDNAQNKV